MTSGQQASAPAPPLRVVVMGVSGSGKSTVGELLAATLQVEFADADDFHNPANIAKMASGIPLTDEDRWPWLEAVGQWLDEHQAAGAVVTCSALKRSHRNILRAHARDVWFLHCAGSAELIGDRIARRSHEFMPASLLASQFEALQPPDSDEHAITEEISQEPTEMVADFLSKVARRTRGSHRPDDPVGSAGH
jgi:gluconokinase